jgi:hypothetical protein
MTFDADAHVEESAQTWKHLDEKFARRRPERRDQSQDSKRQRAPVFFTLILMPLDKKALMTGACMWLTRSS